MILLQENKQENQTHDIGLIIITRLAIYLASN